MNPADTALRVLMVGPAPAGAISRGGMATVAALMTAHPDPRVRVTMVPTFVNSSVWRWLLVGVCGMLRASWLVLGGHADVLHVHLAHGGSVVRKALPLWAARLAGVPAVIHGHSYDFGGWFDRLPPLGRALVRRALVADHWVVLGERHVAEYADRLRLPGKRITVLRNAVEIPGFAVAQSGVERVHVVALGRLGVRKGSYDVIAAVAALDETVRRRLRVTLAGDGEVDELRAAVAAAGLCGTVDVAGWLDAGQRDALLSAARIFLLPSRDEGLPMALLEAMARGLVPVTTTAGSMGEVVSDGVTGLLVSPNRPDEIANALTALVGDEALRVRLGAAARSRAGDFGLDRWYEQLTRLWTDLSGDPEDRPVSLAVLAKRRLAPLAKAVAPHWFWRRKYRILQELGKSHPELRLVRSLCDPDRVSLDIGAAVGQFAIAMLGSSRSVIAFEPRPAQAGCLAATFGAVGAAVRVEAVALSDEPGVTTMRVPASAPGRSTIDIDNTLSGADDGRIGILEVPVMRLDDLHLDNVGFVKIDVEGHELAVLRGAADTLTRNRPALYIEAEERHHPHAVAAITEFLAGLGYAGYFEGDGIRRPVAEFDVGEHQNAANTDRWATPGSYVNNFVFLPTSLLQPYRQQSRAALP
jgi:FkbM family methyltransferase